MVSSFNREIALTEEKYLMVGYPLSKKKTALHEEKCPMASPAPSTETQYSMRRIPDRWTSPQKDSPLFAEMTQCQFSTSDRESAFFKEKCLFVD